MKCKGAQILMEILLEQGCDVVFGYPGGTVLDIYEELYRYEGKIRHILTSHEQGAAHAADGYARATGKVGVCLATSGPGATNLVTGIATAYLDSIPLLAITGNVASSVIGQDTFQEVDIVGVTLGIVKHSYTVRRVEDLAFILREAFSLASSGRPGPVLVDIPKDIQQAMTEFFPATGPAPKKKPASLYTEKEIEEAVSMLKASKKPCLYIGGGVLSSDAGAEVLAMAEKIDAVICQSLLGLSAVSAENPRVLGMSGMHGGYAANRAIHECDLLIAVGARFSDRAGGDKKKFAKNAAILHIDADQAEIDKNVKSTLGLIGDAKEILERLNARLETVSHPEWQKDVAGMKRLEKETEQHFEGVLSPYGVIDEVAKVVNPDTPIVTDVGQHQMWVAQRYPFQEPRTCLSSGGLGTMGYGMGAANGAAVATGKKTVLFTGDGSFAMNMNELGTAVTHGLPVIVVLMNNRVLGMVRQLQNFFSHAHYSQTTTNRRTDFVGLAEAFGAIGLKAATPDEFREAFQKAWEAEGPALIECQINPDDFVYPMVPPNRSFEEIMLPKKQG